MPTSVTASSSFWGLDFAVLSFEAVLIHQARQVDLFHVAQIQWRHQPAQEPPLFHTVTFNLVSKPAFL